jgi:ribulose-phosphate 3-epimerase
MSRIIRTVPAILTDDPAALEKMVRQTETFTDYAQFDIMDGRFVPSRSITCEHIARLNTRLSWEVHLMVRCPEAYLDDFRRAGAQKAVFHYEATATPGEVGSQARELGLKVGLAINPETPVAAITPLVKELDSVLFLSVNPGFYGSPFLSEVLDKIGSLRQTHPGLEIGIDGGIKESNIARIARSGVDVIYVGSAIYRQAEPAASYRRLKALAEASAPP